MAQEIPLDIRAFKGINIREPEGMIQDDELASCINLNIGRAGELTKRTGFAILHNGQTLGNNRVRLLGQFQTHEYSQLIAKAGNNLYYSTNGADWTLLGVANDGTDVTWGVQYANKFYILSTSKDLQSWNGTTLTTITNGPRGTFGLIYKDRLFVCNSVSQVEPSRIKYSAPGNLENWPATNFIDIRQGDGDVVTCLAIIHDLLIIFKTITSWALYVQGGPETWVLRNINPEIGCISKYTPREIEGFLFFVGVRGVYKTDGNIFENISENIEPVFRDRVVASSTIDIDAGSWWDDRYILLFHPTSSTFKYFVYHLRTGGWTEWQFNEDITPAFFVEINTNSPQKGLYAGTSATTGRVYRHGDEAFTDAGANYTCSFRTKNFDFTLASLMKRGKWLMVDIDTNASTTWTQFVEQQQQVQIQSTQATSQRRAHKIRGPGYFRIWQLHCSHTSNRNFTFYGVTLWIAQKRAVIKART